MAIKEEYIISRQGRQHVLYGGLLNAAHELGLSGIETELLQIPSPENKNVAIVKATIKGPDDEKFQGIGDASPDNVSRNIAPHLIRMAETRAKARAMRDFVNVGEALSDDETTTYEDDPNLRRGQAQRQGRQRTDVDIGQPVREVNVVPERKLRNEKPGEDLPDGVTRLSMQEARQMFGPMPENEGGDIPSADQRIELTRLIGAAHRNIDNFESAFGEIPDVRKDFCEYWIKVLSYEAGESK